MPRYIIAGPPCSGKSTYVRDRAQRGDLVYDYDAIHQALSGQPLHQHNSAIRPYVLAARDAVYGLLEANGQQSAWIITSTPKTEQLSALRDRFGAEVVLLMVDREEAHRRCEVDSRPEEWHGYIDNWFEATDIEPKEWLGKGLQASVAATRIMLDIIEYGE